MIGMCQFDLSVELLAQVLKFPDGAQIYSIAPSTKHAGAITVIVTQDGLKHEREGGFIPVVSPIAKMRNGRLDLWWDTGPSE